jgi:MFS family permease
MKGPYRFYVLGVLLAANVLNYADRSVLSVLAEAIKHDLKISDAQLGFLAGTSFVLFNAIIGVAVGKLVDGWRRNRLLSIGVALWSAMTALSGLAGNFPQLCAARLGIGVGEASVGTTAYSLITDIFSARWRAAAMAVVLFGPSIALSICLSAGGWIVQHWPGVCAGAHMCAFKGWQAAFLVFGLPGLLVSVLVAFIGEPAQGAAGERRARARPLSELAGELSLLLPPFTLFRLWRLGGAPVLRANLIAAVVIAAAAAGLFWLTHDALQWAAVGFGSYAMTSWIQAMLRSDPELSALTISSRTYRALVSAAICAVAFYGAIAFWSTPLAIRTLHMKYAEAGASLGAAIGAGSLLGNLLGGFVADRWRKANPAAPLYVAMGCLVAGALLLALALFVREKAQFALALGAAIVFLTAWVPGFLALLQELVLPSMRGRATAIYIVSTTMISGSIGSYAIGRISDAVGSIREGIYALYILVPIGLFFLARAARTLSGAHADRDRLEAGQA